jgi:hypothetical protein
MTARRWTRVELSGAWHARAREALLPLIDEEPPILTHHKTPAEVRGLPSVEGTGKRPCPIAIPRPELPDAEHLARRLRYVIDRCGMSAATVARCCGSRTEAIRELVLDPEDADHRALAAVDRWLHGLNEKRLDYWQAYALLADGPGTRAEVAGSGPCAALDAALRAGWILEREGMLWWAGWDD